MGNSKAGGEDDITAKGKYLLISVPEFAKDPISGEAMTSYLRLGAASTTWKDDPGGDLAGNIHLSGPPGAHLANNPAGQVIDIAGDEGDARPVFIDDTRDRVPADPHVLAVGDRLEQSGILHTRGGWRDHSDGNRITTTYGDKIEVIRGNYKMVVLGRQDDPGSSSGWDASGQHIQDWGYTMPGASVRVEWTKEYGGVWHLQNTTEGVVQSSNFAGDFYEYKWGDHYETTVGSDAPHAFDDVGGTLCPRTNPHIIEKTWAVKIEGYTGSSALRVPEIIEETWAETTSSTTDVLTSITETLTCPGAVTSTSTIGALTETTTATTIATATTAGAIAEATTAGAIAGITTAGAIGDVTIAGAIGEVSISGIHGSVELAGNLTELFVGTKISIEIGAILEIFIGFKRELNILPFEKVAPEAKTITLTDIKTSINKTTVAALNRIVGPAIFLGI